MAVKIIRRVRLGRLVRFLKNGMMMDKLEVLKKGGGIIEKY